MIDPVEVLAQALIDARNCPDSYMRSAYVRTARAVLARITPALVAEAVAAEREACTEELRLALAAEREACAWVAEHYMTAAHISADIASGTFPKRTEIHQFIAAAIRARSKT